MTTHIPPFALRLATADEEILAALALRHRVFVEEMGARGGGLSDPLAGVESDRFDGCCEHLLLVDSLRGDLVIGTTRVMTEEGAARAGGFASAQEFDLRPLLTSGRRLLEVGRTCLHPEYRGGAAMHRLWLGLAALVEEQGIELLFGLASFPGTDPEAAAQALSCLHHDHLAPETLRPRSLRPAPVDLLPREQVNRRDAMLATPALVKAYLRLGGRIGEGAFLDPDFGCIDLCMVLNTDTLSARARSIYGEKRR